MPNSNDFITLEDRFGSGVYAKQKLTIVRGEGARVWDADGRQYIDCVSGHGVANVGHGNLARTLEILCAESD